MYGGGGNECNRCGISRDVHDTTFLHTFPGLNIYKSRIKQRRLWFKKVTGDIQKGKRCSRCHFQKEKHHLLGGHEFIAREVNIDDVKHYHIDGYLTNEFVRQRKDGGLDANNKQL